ncbi:hypothetical protein E2C01_026484 [Portunus trituberculatus]|uniref:Platelet-derived growth factor (PDGF) family profile domain-containing protein n=1 Tax=Portunus trituberculatus TaxID=210409 RepID=A0A5B7EFR3_PORTR|nr:hypothetical protein [Portunus trituberculatus]
MAALQFFVISMAAACLASVSCLPSDRNTYLMLKNQKEALEKLKCEPKAVWVTIESQLEFHDDLADKDFFPMVVSVKRCLEECSFCGNAALGVPSKKCKPKDIVDRDIVVKLPYDEQESSRFITIKEHKSCASSQTYVGDENSEDSGH